MKIILKTAATRRIVVDLDNIRTCVGELRDRCTRVLSLIAVTEASGHLIAFDCMDEFTKSVTRCREQIAAMLQFHVQYVVSSHGDLLNRDYIMELRNDLKTIKDMHSRYMNAWNETTRARVVMTYTPDTIKQAQAFYSEKRRQTPVYVPPPVTPIAMAPVLPRGKEERAHQPTKRELAAAEIARKIAAKNLKKSKNFLIGD